MRSVRDFPNIWADAVPKKTLPPYQVAQSVLDASELAIARGSQMAKPSKLFILEWSKRYTLPIELVISAAQPGFLALIKWAALITLSLIFIYGIIKPSGLLNAANSKSYWLAGGLFITLCSALVRPSVRGFSGWHASNLQSAKQRCNILEEVCEPDLEAVQYFVDHAITCTKERILTLQWITGALWAITIYLTQKGLETRDGNLILQASFVTFVALFIFAIISAYARSIAHVHGLSRALIFERKLAARSQP